MRLPALLSLSLLFAFALAAPALGQRVRSLDDLTARVDREKRLPASKRTGAINLFYRYKIPAARDFLLDMLPEEKAAAVRAAIFKQLRYHPHRRCFEAMSASLQKDKNRSVLNGAAHGLTGQGEKGRKLLMATLGSGTKAQRDAALYGLGFLTKRADVQERLLELFRKAKPADAEAVLRSLSRLRSDPMTQLRLKALKHKNKPTRVEALYQLVRNDHPGLTKHLRAMAKDKELRKNKLQQAKLFYIAGCLVNLQTLQMFLDLGREAGRFAKSQLGYLAKDKDHSSNVRGALERASVAKRELNRYTAFRLLAGWPNDDVVPTLRHGLKDKSIRIARRCVRELAERGDKAAGSLLVKLLQHQDEDLAGTALQALHKLRKKTPGWAGKLIGYLRKFERLPLKLAALDFLKELRYRPALQEAQEMLLHERWEVRSAAVSFLLVIRDESTVPLIIDRLDKETGRLFFEMLTALRSLTGKTYRQPNNWRRWWENNAKNFKVVKPRKSKKGEPTGAGVMTYYSLPLTSKRVCFVIDTSGSMAQKTGTAKLAKIKVAKQALMQVIEKCPEDFLFNLIPFSSDPRTLNKQLLAADEKHKKRAAGFVKRLKAKGGTNIYDGMRLAFANRQVDTIYLLSDGYPSAGLITNIHELADEIRDWNRSRRIIIHGISLGGHSELLRRLARESGGTYVKK